MAEDDLTEILNCPIGFALMENPVTIVESQMTCDRESLEKWRAINPTKCPISGAVYAQPIKSVNNVLVRDILHGFKRHNNNNNNNNADDGDHRPAAAATMQEDARRILTCPVSGELMTDPVMIIDTQTTCDRKSICNRIVLSNPCTCPATGAIHDKPLSFFDNVPARQLLQLFFGNQQYQRHHGDNADFETYDAFLALRFGMNRCKIDHAATYRLLMNADQNDAVVFGLRNIVSRFGPKMRTLDFQGNEWQTWKQDMKSKLAVDIAAGNKWAQCIFGWIAAIELDSHAANRHFERASDQGHTIAHLQLAQGYYDGSLGTKDYDKALKYFKRAAAQGNADAQFQLGLMLEIAPHEDYAKAMEYFVLAAAQGHDNALFKLGLLYNGNLGQDYGVANDAAKALEYFELAAARGNADAQFKLATAVLPADVNKAVENFELAAKQGYSCEAQYKPACLLRDGHDSIAVDVRKALLYFDMAAVQGHLPSLFALGVLLWTSALGSAELHADHRNNALKYFEQAAELGHSASQRFLAFCFHDELGGVARDLPKALRYYNMAAAQGNVSCLLVLANLHWNGLGNELHADRKEGLKYLEQAAELGRSDVQYRALWIRIMGRRFGISTWRQHKAMSILYMRLDACTGMD